ncbi:SET domain-containing protein [Endozoicomonas ascidiicola]|uniref:SET domain-containing protein n=1 Tax=Endozoicomonas ascidiicola TaxID=1698521 RepID=UPI00082B6459|nr:SET domain-containing protein-lysine N-methyltransferase [Endozoicomonas ascidiicola]
MNVNAKSSVSEGRQFSDSTTSRKKGGELFNGLSVKPSNNGFIYFSKLAEKLVPNLEGMDPNEIKEKYISSMHSGLRLQESKISGKGIFATENISHGTELAEFKGHLVGREIATELQEAEDFDSDYYIQVDEHHWMVDIVEEPANYFNHSCEPNAMLDPKAPLATRLLALCDIRKGEEVTYDYGTQDKDIPYSMDCRCNSSECRGIVSSKDYLNPDFQRARKGMFPAYIQVTLDRLNNSSSPNS